MPRENGLFQQEDFSTGSCLPGLPTYIPLLLKLVSFSIFKTFLFVAMACRIALEE
jgi:hypothetical protein